MCASMALHLGLPVSMAQETKLSDAESINSHQEVHARHVQLRALWSSVFMDRYVRGNIGMRFFQTDATETESQHPFWDATVCSHGGGSRPSSLSAPLGPYLL